MQDSGPSLNIWSRIPGIAAAVSLLLASARHVPAASLQFVGQNQQAAASAAVAVEGYALAHTAQLLPLDKQGQAVGPGSVEAQLAQSLFNLETALAAAGSGTAHLVKLNVYVDGPKTTTAARAMLNKRFPLPRRPAMTWVTTALPHPRAGLALDAVAVVPGPGPAAVERHRGAVLAGYDTAACAAVLPRGEVVYVAGQAEKGELPIATAKTLERLLATIGHLGLKSSHVVHVKAFLRPMEQADLVREQLAQAFAGQTPPPLTLVAWQSDLPVEIELIACVPPETAPPAGADTVSYFTPPGMTKSPLYSRVARVHGGKTIYVSGLYAEKPGSGEAQVRDLFAALDSTLKLAGSDLRHLVKATYYCADDESSAMLNKLRPEFFDPQRPPAASKAMVQGVAVADRSITMDMIAVTPP
jgi:enamine deaminase RidA (YjgF/YER057c/UK114 family)